MKAPTLSSAKKKAWSTLSLWIRTKDSINGYCTCKTCGWTGPINTMQAGHWIPKAQGNSIYFEENNIHVQCYRCNINLGGNGPEYFTYMLRTYGQDELDRLKTLAKTSVKFKIHDYQRMESEYKEKLKAFE